MIRRFWDRFRDTGLPIRARGPFARTRFFVAALVETLVQRARG